MVRVLQDQRLGKDDCTVPTYEYECFKCGRIIEVEQKITDDRLTHHRITLESGEEDLCGPVKRIISPTGFILKGSGWAKDGYSSSGGKPKKKGGTKDGNKRTRPQRAPRPPK